jgi:hypothetical protein
MVAIERKHLQYLLDYVEDIFDCGEISIETNTDILSSIDKLNAILAARVALNKGDYHD